MGGKGFLYPVHTDIRILSVVSLQVQLRRPALLVFSCVNNAYPGNCVYLLPSLILSGGWYVYQQRNEVHNNCGIEIYYQTDMQTTHDNMLLELFCQIISEPCFNTLRTKEQLGEPKKHKHVA